MSICTHSISYVHIPKTAGTSILEWVRTVAPVIQEWETHPKNSVLKNVCPNNVTFTVIRNPWDRMVSAYHYLRQLSLPEGSSWLSINCITEENFPTFEDWILNLHNYQNPEAYWFRPETPQSLWLDAPVEIILRYETLVEDFVQIQELFSNKIELPHHYKSKRSNYKDYYNDVTKSIVASLNESDIDLFKYTY